MKKLTFIFLVLTLLLTGCSIDGKKLANEMDLKEQSFCQVKQGHYQGGCTEQENIGYIYYTDELTQEEAMEQAGFQKRKQTTATGRNLLKLLKFVRIKMATYWNIVSRGQADGFSKKMQSN